MSRHACPGQCGRSVTQNRLACRDCWRLLPLHLQRALTEADARKRRLPADASHAIAHRVVLGECLAWYRDNDLGRSGEVADLPRSEEVSDRPQSTIARPVPGSRVPRGGRVRECDG